MGEIKCPGRETWALVKMEKHIFFKIKERNLRKLSLQTQKGKTLPRKYFGKEHFKIEHLGINEVVGYFCKHI